LRLDTARYERAEKRGKISEANKIAERIEGRKSKQYELELAQNQTLAKMSQDESLAMEGFKIQRAQIAATRAGQFNLDRDFLNIETQKGIEDYRAREGKDPVGKDLANIRSTAVTKVAEMKRYSPYGASNVDIRLQSEITEAQRYDEGIKNLRVEYLAADDKDKPAIQAKIQARLDEVARTVQSRVQRPGVPTTTTTPPPATTQSLQPGQIVVDANGNRAKYVGGDPKDPKSYQAI
jgi:hypothetical protein